MKGSETMKTELVYVTPKMARNWLTMNTINRDLRPYVVAGLLQAYQRGEWKLTHQGIALTKSGNILDGQHRLTFISQLPENAKVPINVTHGLDEDAFDAIDIGVRRTMSDVYKISAGLSAVGRLFAKIVSPTGGTGITNQYVYPFVEWAQPEYEELITFCGQKCLVWSSAPMQAAAVVQMKRGRDHDFIKLAYNSLVHMDIDTMPYAARALVQQHMSGKIVSARSLDLFCRGLRVFDSTNNRKISSILVKDQAATVAEVREWMEKDMKKSPAKAGLKVAKPSGNFNWNKAA